jgi:hypothetical protein
MPMSVSIQNGFPKSALMFCRCSIELKKGLLIRKQNDKIRYIETGSDTSVNLQIKVKRSLVGRTTILVFCYALVLQNI